jgi:hypothetical protein
MTKVALLIGVSEYGSGLNPLPSAGRDVELVRQVLQPSEGEGFDEVKSLLNPNPPMMRKAIETLFSSCTNDDLVLLFFSGHVVQDDKGNLYLATAITCKNPQGELIRVSAIPASFVHDLMKNSPCQHQVVILDCCVDRVYAQETTSNDDLVDIQTLLGGKGRTILSSFTPYQDAFKLENVDHSGYTCYLVEGIRTGAADLDKDSWIAVDELHEYAKNKVQIAAPALKPKFFTAEDGHKILLSRVPIDDSKLKYRKEAESWVSRGEISQAGRYVLDKLVESLQLSYQDCSVIEAEVLKPYKQYQEKLQDYQRVFAKAISNDYPLDTQAREKLKGVQQALGLRDEDVAPIEERMALKLANLPKSDDDADELAPGNSQNELNSVSSTPSTVLSDFAPIPLMQPIDPTPASDQVMKIAEADSQPNGLPSTPNAALPESPSRPLMQPIDPTPAVNLPSSVADSQISSASTSPNKLLLPFGIGGALVTLVLAIGIFTRLSVGPPVAPANQVSSSPTPSATLSPEPAISDNKPSPSPSASPENKVCTVFVNGNLRSEPAAFRNNIVEPLKAAVPVTGKRTKGGWVEVKLPDNELAWAHPDIMKNHKEMEACVASKGIPVQTLDDPLPPASNSFP